MYAVHRQTHPPTGIEHCVYCYFFSTHEKNLVIAGTSQLHVYRLNPDIELPSKSKAPEQTSGAAKKQKLECLGSFSLFGNIMDMQTVRLAGASRDSILLGFQDAKLSLVEYDPGTHSLKTSSLHYFEEPGLSDGFQQQINIPTIRVDPDARCAAMVIYGSHLVILPFRREGSAEDMVEGVSKSTTLSSYIIDARKLDEKISNIIDLQFLHGYYEPTLFILYEPLRTWSGRIAVRRDTCAIVAISLNMQQKVHPIIWSLSNLPYDSIRVEAVPKPIGGVLVFAANSLMYLNQSVPPFGVSLNSISSVSSSFPLRPQEGVKMALDCVQTAFIDNDKLVLSLKGGELYVLTLMVDGMRAVRSFNFDKAAASVLTTCMCACKEGYLFLGSRLGNSLLLKYTEKALDTSDEPKRPTEEPPPTKKKRLDTMGDWMASDVSQIDDLDELEVYGSEMQAGTQINAYTFEVCDSIMNIGPCGQMVMGEPAFLSEEFSGIEDPDIELVTTSGYGKNGALSVLQRSIRPQVVTTFELPGCLDMWTVIGSQGPSSEKTEGEEKGEKEENKEVNQEEGEMKDDLPDKEHSHAFLILSREDSSMILQTGQEIMELDHSGFSTQAPTVFAGNIGNNKYILQVSPKGLRLLEGVKQLQHIPLDMGSPIKTCSVADPYAVIVSEEGQVMLLNLRQDSFGSGVRLAVMRPQVSQKSKVLALCTYRDVSGMFTTTGEDQQEEAPATAELKTPSKADTMFSFDKSTADDEDELLYGDSDMSVFSPDKMKAEAEAAAAAAEAKKKEIKPTYWTALYRENGQLEIYSLPEFKLAFLVKTFAAGHKVLIDSGQVPEKSKTEKQDKLSELPSVKELLLVGLGNKKSRPYLMARIDEDLFIYEAFPYHSASLEEHLKLRFKKYDHNLILRAKKSRGKKKTDVEEEDDMLLENDNAAHLRYFEDISGYAGVFVCGPYPHWIFMTPRGSLRIHPMGIDGSVVSFAPFHNINCPKGFLYFNRQGELRISVLPTHLSYDAPWPVRKVPLRCTPHLIQYHVDSKTYSVASSILEQCSKVMRYKEDEQAFDEIKKDDRFVYPYVERFYLQLFSPVSWEAIPNTKIEFEEFEHISSLKSVNLKSEGTVTGLKGYMAVGTTYCYGEEIMSKGRVIIFDIIEVVPEPGQPLTKNKPKILYDKRQKGPITALASVEGLLVTAIGQKIYMWTFKDNDLSGVAFIDTQIYIHSMYCIKNLILIADIQKSVTVLQYQENMRVLSQVSKDTKPLCVYGSDFLVDNTQLGFLVSDREKNLIVFMYQPEARESCGGTRLIRKAEINIGTHVNTFFRIRCKVTDPSTIKRASAAVQKRHVTFFATLDGGVGYLLPITEKIYRRLLMLQNALTIHIPHLAGLNPKSFRSLTSPFKQLINPNKNILDGELLWKYLSLGSVERNELAKKIGTSSEQLFDDLMDIDRLSAHF